MADTRTPEQKTADENLLQAIQQVVNLRERDPDAIEQGDLLVMEYIVVAACSSITLQENDCTQYAYCTKDSGTGPFSSGTHSLIGLCHMGLDWLGCP